MGGIQRKEIFSAPLERFFGSGGTEPVDSLRPDEARLSLIIMLCLEFEACEGESKSDAWCILRKRFYQFWDLRVKRSIALKVQLEILLTIISGTVFPNIQ